MTRIDFYILPDQTPASRALFSCRLAEKVYRMGSSVFIHTRDAQQAEQLDKQLWTFKQNSFVPHAIEGESPDPETPVLIGYKQAQDSAANPNSRQVLINLDTEVPLFFSTFERVAEVIDQSDEQRQKGRERFRFYRDRGYTLETHKL